MFSPIPCSVDEAKLSETSLLLESRRKDESLAALAHQLRNPLAPIRAGIELLKRSGDDPVMVLLARSVMERQVKHMTRLIDDLMDISKIARGQLKLRFERVNLDAVLQGATEACRPNLEVVEQHLHVGRVPDDAVVYGDATRLYEILCNVLNNAVKYTPPQGEISIMTRREPCHVVVTVADNGVGMAADELPHIFEMYSQVRPGTRGSDGLGMGLAIAKRLVALHGGQIEASSAGLGCGSKFTIDLPAAGTAATPPRQETSAGLVSSWQRVLVADDNRDSARGLALLLERSGYEVRTAADGAEALTVYADFEPEVVILDLEMPVVDGFAVARSIRNHQGGSRALLIATTGWGQREDRLCTNAAGFDHRLVKPFAFEELEHAISKGRSANQN